MRLLNLLYVDDRAGYGGSLPSLLPALLLNDGEPCCSLHIDA
jgi:hypothetical protein